MESGEVSPLNYEDVIWDEEILQTKQTIVTEPFLDSVSNQTVISVVSPVFSMEGEEIIGFAGLDVFQENLSVDLSGIKIGKNGYLELVSSELNYIYSVDLSGHHRPEHLFSGRLER